jgi:cephalosporin hydroxylase
MVMKGHLTYSSVKHKMNLTAQQNQNMFDAFKFLLNEYRPKRVLEIGTAGGGTIQFIKDYLEDIGSTDTTIRTFDVKEHKWYNDMRRTGIEIIVENIFSHSYREIEKPEFVVDYINQEGPTLVLCDGGSKINEFKILSRYLKKGDVIMAHDYVNTKENFLENFKDKIWNWREIGDEHIVESCRTHNLKPYLQEHFNNAAWVCKIKE